MMLDKAIAQAEIDLQNSPLYASHRCREEKQLEVLKKQNLSKQQYWRQSPEFRIEFCATGG